MRTIKSEWCIFFWGVFGIKFGIVLAEQSMCSWRCCWNVNNCRYEDNQNIAEVLEGNMNFYLSPFPNFSVCLCDENTNGIVRPRGFLLYGGSFEHWSLGNQMVEFWTIMWKLGTSSVDFFSTGCLMTYDNIICWFYHGNIWLKTSWRPRQTWRRLGWPGHLRRVLAAQPLDVKFCFGLFYETKMVVVGCGFSCEIDDQSLEVWCFFSKMDRFMVKTSPKLAG